MKKIISLLAIAALSLTTFSTAFAKADLKVPEAEKATPVITGEFVMVDTDGTYQFDIKYEAGTTLTEMKANKGKYTGTAINSIDATLEIDPTVWDVSDPDNMVFTDQSSGVLPGATCAFNKLENKIVFTWSSSAPNTYISAESGSLYTIWLTPKDTSLDGSKVSMNFSTALVQIETQTSGTITAQTEYSNLSSADYAISTVFGPAVPEEPEITINNKYVFNFTADAGEEVMVKLTRANGIESDLTYSLPELVKGEASIFGLLKVTDDTVVSGDKFDISVVDADRNPVKAITTITVE
jgi:hypothetical protein